MTGHMLETDSDSGAAIYAIGADPRFADNIYGEQPYGDSSGRRIAIRYYPQADRPGGLAILDLVDGSRHDVLTGDPRFPAFHAWGRHLYYQQTVDGELLLRRCRYDTLETENVAALPAGMGSFSYGTVSPDLRFYAVCILNPDGGPSKLHLLDLRSGKWRLLLDKPGYHAKHEQFSRDGNNRVLIQLNHLPAVEQVLLGDLTLDGGERLFPADRPHTPRPTGHEAWIGTGSRIFFSTGSDPDSAGNLWTAALGDARPEPVCPFHARFGHVSVSRCGRFWLGDTNEPGIPVYAGRFGSGSCRRLVFTRTVYDGKQWSHAHPYLTADNQWLIFTSTRGGHAQVYAAKLAAGWLDQL